MSNYKPRRNNRRKFLLKAGLTPREAHELSVLPRHTPALRALVADRIARMVRYDRIFRSKVAKGKWRERDYWTKWLANLSRMYYKCGWRVQKGAVGRQRRMVVGSPNPWALYRSYEKVYPGKNYVSPWEVKAVATGKTGFQRGQIFLQKAQMMAKSDGSVSKPQIQNWIDTLTQSIRKTTDKGERARLAVQRHRLEGLI